MSWPQAPSYGSPCAVDGSLYVTWRAEAARDLEQFVATYKSLEGDESVEVHARVDREETLTSIRASLTDDSG